MPTISPYLYTSITSRFPSLPKADRLYYRTMMDSTRTWRQRSISESLEEDFRRRHERAGADVSASKQAKESLFRSGGLRSIRRFLRISRHGEAQKRPSASLVPHSVHVPVSGQSHTEVRLRGLIQAHEQRDRETGSALLNRATGRETNPPDASIDGRRFAVYFATPAVSQCDSIYRISDAPILHNSHEHTASLYYPPRPTSRPPHLHRPTSLPESSESDDLPPQYAASDPYPFFDTEFGSRRRSTTRILDTVRVDGFRATTGRVGRSMLHMVTDVPSAVQAARARMNSRRARAKIRWLEQRNYLSGQDRALTQELIG
ncbi:uncharacterized protein SETTUDRAFT_31412 [Exserohilum turcica Et28A]|uniref:Uncharacterized protein n=1 Tax=Exserohilum turcicum (strain 28A) TaxID=671987 RepID=R0IQC2_EXST2|nr:uncharacterized protein SETTUDRAFT_31412 [Exserohilum turcica Et28A]EOA87105.1 hypothetical protein SETTUDRAFT_31412 [Exserohilum turcica Et28A]